MKIPRAVARFPNLGVDFWDVTSAPLENLGNIRTPVRMADVVGGGSVVNGMEELDADAAPIVQYQAFAHPADRAVVLASIRWIRDLYRTSTLLAGYGPVEVAPGAAAQTDEAMWDALVSGGLVRPSNSHPSGTCAMMPAALGGCVGADLLVHETRRLGVVDASVMPLIPGTNLQATVYAVAEKAADVIKTRNQ
ncbi:uncharacterized protein PG986_005919 [Apiospora aurea]|uniref:Glucose-methanol-choline oxidoreductase C-terminal domain-containing protein n=1 Tax=Apiospora aurea TaxID=335848 RepID=A0ABR1QJR0_9PEZI